MARTFARKSDRGAVIVVIFDEKADRVAVVMEESKPAPHYWKFPGGGIEDGDVDRENPHDAHLAADRAAKREGSEETGLVVREVMRVSIINKRTHTVYLYAALASFDTMKERGEEGEIPRAFSVEQLKAHPNFFPSHRTYLDMVEEKIRQGA